MSDIKNHVLEIIRVLESGIDSDGKEIDSGDYMQDVLDINWVLNQDRTLKGARLLVAFGGPNIWIDTVTQTVEGYWWNDRFEASYHTDAMGLDEYVEMMWGCER